MIDKRRLGVFALFIITPNILLWSGIIGTEGIIISGDFNFPIRNENFQKYYFPLWNDLSSQTNFERLPRLVMLSPYIALASAGIDISAVLKIFVISTYTFLTLSMYLFLEAIQKYFKLKDRLGRATEIFSILGGFAFAYNPVSLQFAGGISILFSIGALPLLLYVILTRIDSKYFPLFIAGIFLLSLGHPFSFLMNATVGLLFLVTIHWKRLGLKFAASKIGFSVFTFMMLFAWYWIPYVAYPIDSSELGREGNLEREIFDVISNNDSWDIVLLERDRFLYVETMPVDPLQSSFHYASLILLIGIAIVGVLVSLKKIPVRIALFLLGGFAITAMLSMGSKGPFGEAYYSAVSNSDVGWTFRSPLKFQLYESFFASSLFGISLALLHTKMSRIRFVSIALAIMILTGVSSYGIFNANASSLKPILFPAEYYEINKMLEERDDGYKVLYYPVYAGTATTWSEGHNIGTFDMKSSSVPTYELSTNYNNIKEMLIEPYRKAELFRTYNYYDYLSSIDIRYIVFHDDMRNPIDKENLGHLLRSYQTQLLYNQSNWYLFELKTEVAPPINAVNNLALAGEQDDIFRVSKPQLGSISESSYDSFIAHQPDNSRLVKLAVSKSDIELRNTEDDPKYDALDLLYNYEKNWQLLENDFDTILTPDSAAGKSGIIISTSQTERKWSWLYSDPVDIQSSDTILFSFHMKTENTNGTHIKILGFIESEDRWRDIAFVTSGIDGDSGWQDYWSVIQSSPDITKVRYVINAGSVLKASDGKATTSIDDASIVGLGNASSSAASIVHYEKISPTLWRADVRATEPYILSFAETYDKHWSVRLDGSEVESFMLYGAINGFYIDKIGEYSLEIHYRPQQLFDVGATLSAVALVAFIAYFGVAWRYKRTRITSLIRHSKI